MKLFTFSSEGTQYVDLALKCVQNFAKFGIEVTHVCNKNFGRITENIFERTHAMLRIARQNPTEAVGWVDADVVPLQRPEIFDAWDNLSKEWDLACTCRPEAGDPSHRHCCGVVLWPAGGGKGLEWLSRTLASDDSPMVHCREQWYLSRVIKEMNLKVFNLGEAYNDPCQTSATIIHHSDQAVKPQHDVKPTPAPYKAPIEQTGPRIEWVLANDGSGTWTCKVVQ